MCHVSGKLDNQPISHQCTHNSSVEHGQELHEISCRAHAALMALVEFGWDFALCLFAGETGVHAVPFAGCSRVQDHRGVGVQQGIHGESQGDGVERVVGHWWRSSSEYTRPISERKRRSRPAAAFHFTVHVKS